MEIQPQFTRGDLTFISDVDLRNILLERLSELQRAVSVQCNLSTIILACSTIEGIFKSLEPTFKKEIEGLKVNPDYPNYKGKPKRNDDLLLEDYYTIFRLLDILPTIKGLEKVYNLFRDYRNFVHPQRALRNKDWPVGLGQAQMALGLLNATIDHLASYLFIGHEKFHRVSGQPDYANGTLHLKRDRTFLHSFVVWDKAVLGDLSLSFNLELPKDSIFNFVFNFKSDANFKMIRLDNRDNYRNHLLHSTQKYDWVPILNIDPEKPPKKSLISVMINIDHSKQIFEFLVDNESYVFLNKKQQKVSLFKEFEPNLRIGFFNEEGPVCLSKISGIGK